jgi:hypothetical protein
VEHRAVTARPIGMTGFAPRGRRRRGVSSRVSGLAAVAAVAAAALLAGCGNGLAPEATEPPPSGSTSTTISVPPTGTSLSITISGSQLAPEGPMTYTLSCVPAGGTLPGAAAACIKLANPDRPFFDPPATTEVCADVVSGDGVIKVTGVWQQQSIDALFNQTDSCSTARFIRIARVFGFTIPPTAPTG